MTSLASRAASGGFSTLLFQALRFVIGFGALIVIARLLPPSDFGTFALVLAVVGFADIIRDFGLMNAAVQAPTLSQRQRTNLFWINLTIGLTAASIICLSAPTISAFFDLPRMLGVLQVASVIFVINGLAVQFKSNLTRSMRFMALNLSETVGQFLGSVCAIVAAFQGFGVWALVIQHIVNALVVLFITAWNARWVPGLPGRAPMGALLKYGGGLTGQQILTYVVRNIDTVAIGRFYPAATVGFYDRAYQILMIPIGQLNAPLTRVALPILSRLWRSKDRFIAYLGASQLVAAYITVPIFAVMAGSGESVVRILLGPGWGQAGLILQILAIGGIFRSLMQATYWAYLSSGRTDLMLKFDVVALPAVACCMLVGVAFGPVAVAVGHSVGYALYWLAGLTWMTARLNIPRGPLLSTAIKSLVGTALPIGTAGWVVSYQTEPGWTGLILGLTAGMVALLLPVLFVAQIRSEYMRLSGMLNMAISRDPGDRSE